MTLNCLKLVNLPFILLYLSLISISQKQMIL